jgi:hypothetical protein
LQKQRNGLKITYDSWAVYHQFLPDSFSIIILIGKIGLPTNSIERKLFMAKTTKNTPKQGEKTKPRSHQSMAEEVLAFLTERQVSVKDARIILQYATDHLSYEVGRTPMSSIGRK